LDDRRFKNTTKTNIKNTAKAGIFDVSVYGRDDMIKYELQNIYDIEMDEEGLKYYVACCDKVQQMFKAEL
jgi:hypothetical protein